MSTIYKNTQFWLILAIAVYLLNQLPFLTDMRPVMYDEAWYGNTAYNILLGNGPCNSIVGSGANANCFLPLVTAAFMWLMGPSLLTMRLVAVACGLFTILLLCLTMKHLKADWRVASLTLFLFVSLPLFNTVFRFGRPECLVCVCMAGGALSFLRYLDSPNWRWIISLSIFAFLSGLAHPYGLLFFCIAGFVLLVKAFGDKKMSAFIRLIPLLCAGIFAIAVMFLIGNEYGGFEYGKRLTIQGIGLSLPVYIKDAFFSKNAISTLPFFLVCLYALRKRSQCRTLAIVLIAHFVCFPFLFASDVEMVSLGIDYFLLLSVILFAVEAHSLLKMKWFWAVVMVCCMFMLGISQYYNYSVKYEPVNTSMAEEIHSVIPDGSRVYGPIRQWPMAMGADYVSDHARYDVGSPEDYDFVIMNTQDIDRYSNNDLIFPLEDTRFECVLERNTEQYGDIRVYKRM